MDSQALSQLPVPLIRALHQKKKINKKYVQQTDKIQTLHNKQHKHGASHRKRTTRLVSAAAAAATDADGAELMETGGACSSCEQPAYCHADKSYDVRTGLKGALVALGRGLGWSRGLCSVT